MAMACAASASAGPGGRSSGRRPAAPGLPAPSSPTRLSRIQERDDLRHLNDRLAVYIERVQVLETERSSMMILLEEKDESKSREMGTVRRLYEEELADIRASLDGLAGERARLQVDYGHLEEEYRTLQSRNQKNESEVENALAQWRKVEAALSSKDAECTMLLSENRRLHGHFTDLQGTLDNVESVLADAKKQLGSEILRRVDMENQVQTLKEQLDLQKNIGEQEMFEMRRRHESRLAEVDSGRCKELESKVSEAMQQLRQEHQAQLQQYREETDKTFTSKLENAQQAALDNKDVASATREELESTRLRVETLSSQLQQQQQHKMEMSARCEELERSLEQQRALWQDRLADREQEMLGVRRELDTQLEEHHSLLHVKLALDMEINAYRKMLEMEEQRLQLSPVPSQRTSVPHSHPHSSHRPRGKKRKHQGVSGSSHPSTTSRPLTKRGSVSVEEVDMEGKYVRLKNNSDMEQPLGGWVVRRMFPESGDISFHIPPSCVLAAGQTLTIWAAGVEAEIDSGNLILKGHRSWGSITDVRVILLNSNHEEVSERRVCMRASGDQGTQLEFHDEFDSQPFGRQPKRRKKCCCVS